MIAAAVSCPTVLGALPATAQERSAVARARDALAQELARQGVGTLVHYARAVHEHPAYAGLARPGRLARSERLAREVLSLPLYPELTDDEAEAVASAVRAALGA